MLSSDPFSVVLESPPLTLTEEQRVHVRAVLNVASSDSNFAQKAYDALMRILTPEELEPKPVQSQSQSQSQSHAKEESHKRARS